jgi:hypothetical protein
MGNKIQIHALMKGLHNSAHGGSVIDFTISLPYYSFDRRNPPGRFAAPF